MQTSSLVLSTVKEKKQIDLLLGLEIRHQTVVIRIHPSLKAAVGNYGESKSSFMLEAMQTLCSFRLCFYQSLGS